MAAGANVMYKKSCFLEKAGLGILLLSSSSAYAAISGTVFRDFNANGSFDQTVSFNEVGIADVTVKAFDSTGTMQASTTSGTDGTYALTGLVAGADYRLEFSWGQNWLKPGTAGGSSVQFVKDGTSNILMAVNNPANYSGTSPLLSIPVYGAGLAAGDTRPALMAFPYTASGDGRVAGNEPITVVERQQVGTVWGVAYQNKTQRLFTAAFTKRHAGYGPRGEGGVYAIDFTQPSVPVLAGSFDLQGITPANGGAAIDLGTVNRTVGSADYDISTQPSIDLDAFDKVGKTSFGGINLAEDGKTLWLVNLNQRALISVDVSGATATLPGTVNQYPISALAGIPVCTNGVLRPFAIKLYEGKGYLGTVCSAENSGSRSNLAAYVLSFDPGNVAAGFGNALSFPLNYNRESVGGGGVGEWNPWSDVWLPEMDGDNRRNAEPILGDIEFDSQGNMTIALLDRFAHQSGKNNRPAITGSSALASGMSNGDLLKACKTAGGWVIEGSAGCAVNDPKPYSNQRNDDGPLNIGEFFWGDYQANQDLSSLNHEEMTTGGLALRQGINSVVVASFNPIHNIYLTQGIKHYDLTTGNATTNYLLLQNFENTGFAKASGVGDLELLSAPAPLEVGNRIWLDSDSDGIQDAGEAGIQGVQVKLVCGADQVIATTDGSGNYTFSNAAGGNAAFMGFGEDCVLKVDSSQTALASLALTTRNADGVVDNNALTDLRDSDATDQAGIAEIAFTTDSAGENNHTLDVGYQQATSVDLSLTKVANKTSVKRGDTVIYTLTVTNAGPAAASGVVLQDTLPAAVTYVEDDSGGSYVPATGVWTVGNLAKDGVKTLNITVTVK